MYTVSDLSCAFRMFQWEDWYQWRIRLKPPCLLWPRPTAALCVMQPILYKTSCKSQSSKTAKIKMFINHKREIYVLAHLTQLSELGITIQIVI